VEAIGPSAVKAQVLVGGRGKAGGIKFASTAAQGEKVGGEILGMDLKGYTVETVYVEEKLDVKREFYISVTNDRNVRKPLIMTSAKGGMEIEDVPDADIVRRHVDLSFGIHPYLVRDVVADMGLEGDTAKAVQDILQKLYTVYRSRDAELVEINPLVVTASGVIAADARLNIDDESAYRQSDLPKVEEGTPFEQKVRSLGLAYVQLDGDIAIMANGAGMSMATLDAIQYYGGKPANFLDAGGGTSVEPTARAIGLLLEEKPRVIFVNIFGGITRCDDVAKALVQVKENPGIPVPLVVRLVGTNEAEGLKVLQDAGIEAFREMSEAARKACALAKGA